MNFWDILEGLGEASREIGAQAVAGYAKRNGRIRQRVETLVNWPAVDLPDGMVVTPFLSNEVIGTYAGRFRPISMGKCEPEVVGLYLLHLSSTFGASDKQWKAVPWPALAQAYVGNTEFVLQSFGMSRSFVKVHTYVNLLRQVPSMPESDHAVMIGPIGAMVELTTSHGLPNFLAIGVNCLIDWGYAVKIPATGDAPEMIAPTQQIIDRLLMNERQAA